MKAKLKEIDSWKKILEDLRQQNALLKYRLSEIVDDNEDRNFLQLAEYFQNFKPLQHQNKLLYKHSGSKNQHPGFFEMLLFSSTNISLIYPRIKKEIITKKDKCK